METDENILEEEKRRRKEIWDRNRRWFERNLHRLVWLYEGRAIVIRDEAVIACFDTTEEALGWVEAKFWDGSCSVMEARPVETVYTHRRL
jgi:hypothetical protein